MTSLDVCTFRFVNKNSNMEYIEKASSVFMKKNDKFNSLWKFYILL